ncbi:MAG: hypothetical protein R3F61_13655 [Myxococcota bacterium]
MPFQRAHISLFLIPFAVACASNWTGDPFPGRFESTPHWKDCDGDGLGDGSLIAPGEYTPAECIDPTGSEQPTCDFVAPGVTPRWVQNSRDCDDTYAASGGAGRNGAQCPQDFGFFAEDGEISSDEYEVVQAGGKEFLIVRNNPLPSGLASLVCEQWRQGSNIEDPGDEPITADIEVLATLDEAFQQGRVVDSIQESLQQPGSPDRWVGWVGVNATEIDVASWGWNVAVPEGSTPPDLGFPFCNGTPPAPIEVLFGVAWPYVDSFSDIDPASFTDTELETQFQELRLVMVVESDVDVPCLTYASDPLICPDQVGCFADLVCERPTLNPQDFQVFETDIPCVTTTE